MLKINLIDCYRNLCDDLRLDSSDKQYVLQRINSEGVGFVSSTLPALAKCVLHAIEIGNLYEAIQITNLTCIARKGRSLRYFRSLLGGIFDDSGVILPSPSAESLLRLRTLCEYAYKLSLPFSTTELKSFTDTFVRNDDCVGDGVDQAFVDEVRKSVEKNFSTFLADDPHTILSSFAPRPGPGTFSGAPKDWFLWKTKPSPSKFRNFIVGKFKGLLRSIGGKMPIPQHSDIISDCSELLFVPKDSRGPRTIVREPRDNLLFQMSFHDWFTSRVQYATFGRIQFVSQDINKSIARNASIDASYATLDLKNASDMVPNSVVKTIFRNIPSVMFFLKRFRTGSVLLPDGSVKVLKKLSGMGSGFTFPIMAFLCHTAISTTISKRCNISYATASRLVYVYGDDICVPTKYVSIAIESLRAVGLVVNVEKSYWRGPFRESCGGDYLAGIDVSPPRLRLSSSKVSAKGIHLFAGSKDAFIYELSQHCKELTIRGLTSLRDYYESIIERAIGPIPYCSNFEFSGVVRYRTDVEYIPDLSTGIYPTTKVYFYVPVKINHQLGEYHMNGRLLRGYNPLEFSQVVDTQNIALPRRGKLRRVSVSTYAMCTGVIPRDVREDLYS